MLFQNCGAPPQTYSGQSKSSLISTNVDTTAPNGFFIKKPATISRETDPTFAFNAIDKKSQFISFKYKLDDEDWIPSGNQVQLKNLTPGSHKLQVSASDKKNNTSIYSYSWSVDLDPPEIIFLEKPNDITTSMTGNFSISISDKSSRVINIECYVDNVFIEDCSTLSLNNLKLGLHTLILKAEDQAGNNRDVKYVWSVSSNENVIPEPILVRKPNPYIKGGRPTFHFSAITAGILECFVNSTSIPCEANKDFSVESSSEIIGATGNLLPYQIQARINYNGTLSSPTTYRWFVDNTPPVLTFLNEPTENSRTNNVMVQFSATDKSNNFASLKCLVNGSSLPCESMEEVVLEDLKKGLYNFSVTAQDKAGNKKTITTDWNSASCNKNEVRLQWPLKGQQGSAWMFISTFDHDERAGFIRDSDGRNGTDVKAEDQYRGIGLTTGDFTTVSISASKVHAMAAGIVIDARDNQIDNRTFTPSQLNSCEANPLILDNFVTILHSNGFVTTYRSLQKGLKFKVGDSVARGAHIGNLASSGCSSIPNLYFEVLNCENEQVDPMDLGMLESSIAVTNIARTLNTVIHPGRISTTNYSALMNPVANPVYSAGLDTSVTFSTFITGMNAGTRLQMELTDAAGRKLNAAGAIASNAIQKDIILGSSLGQLLVSNHTCLDVKGDWIWSLYHVKSNERVKLEEKKFRVTGTQTVDCHAVTDDASTNPQRDSGGANGF